MNRRQAARRAYRYTFHPNETVEPTSRQRNTRQRKKESGPTIQLNETEPTLLNQARQRKKSVGPSQTPALRRNPPRSARQRH